jgi:hypothetical protein
MELPAIAFLAVPALWAAAFSLAGPPVRGLRNLGLLGSYAGGAWAFYARGPREAGTAWIAAAAVSAALYFGYDVLVWSKTKQPDALPKSGHFVSALVSWPLMFPEAVEYLLAELGWLGKKAAAPPPPQPGPPREG